MVFSCNLGKSLQIPTYAYKLVSILVFFQLNTSTFGYFVDSAKEYSLCVKVLDFKNTCWNTKKFHSYFNKHKKIINNIFWDRVTDQVFSTNNIFNVRLSWNDHIEMIISKSLNSKNLNFHHDHFNKAGSGSINSQRDPEPNGFTTNQITWCKMVSL